MSYEIVISRGYRWAEDGSFAPILLEEWKAVIASHSELEAVEEIEGINPLTKERLLIRVPNSGRLGSNGGLLTWRDGVIALDCGEDEYERCRSIAQALGAAIYGEEGETL